MAYRKWRRKNRRPKAAKSMVVTVLNPVNRVLSQMGIKNRSLRWALTGITSMQLLKVFAEDQFETVQGFMDDGTDWIQEKLGM